MKWAEGDNLFARCQAWSDLSGDLPAELIDCREHHERFGEMRLFTRTIRMTKPVDGRTMRPPMQETWRRLIASLLAYTGQRTDDDMIGDYQCEQWGRRNGPTCVVELSALAAHNLGVERARKEFLDDRIGILRERLLANVPEFVVFYGLGSQGAYQEIAGGGFDATGFRWSGDTLCLFAEHPVAIPGEPMSWWIEKGQQMRQMIDSRHKSDEH